MRCPSCSSVLYEKRLIRARFARREPIAPPDLGERGPGRRRDHEALLPRRAVSSSRNSSEPSVTTRTLPGFEQQHAHRIEVLAHEDRKTMRGCSLAVASRCFHSVSSSARTPNVSGDLREAVAVARSVEDALAPLVGERVIRHGDDHDLVAGVGRLGRARRLAGVRDVLARQHRPCRAPWPWAPRLPAWGRGCSRPAPSARSNP